MNDLTQFSQNVIFENKTTKSKGWLFAIYTIITMCIYILPALKLRVPYLIAAPLMLISLIYIALKDEQMLKYSISLVFISIYFLLTNLIKNMTLTEAINDMIRNIRFFIPVMWGIFCLRNIGEKQQRTILFCFILMAGFIMIKTLIALEENPLIARLLAQDQSKSDLEVNKYRFDNVGGYAFSYMMGAVFLIVMWMALASKKKLIKILLFVGLIMCYYYIIQAKFTTLLLLVSIGMFVVIITKIRNPLLKCLPIILFVLILVCLPKVLEYIISLFEKNSVLSEKFKQIYDSVTGEGIDALGARPELISIAINNFVKTPIFGGSYTTPAHSLFFEYLQQGGLVGLFLWLILFCYSWNICLLALRENKIDTKLFNIVATYLTVLSIFNDTKACYEITIVVFFITIVASFLFCKKQGEKR